jgi:hypothetical protein
MPMMIYAPDNYKKASFSNRIMADADDGWVRSNVGTVGTDWPIIGKFDANSSHAWIRFLSVTVPKNAIITSARIDFHIYAYGTEEVVKSKIYAHDVSNSGNPTNVNNILNSDPVSPGTGGWYITTSNVNWTVGTGASNSVISTSDISPVVQEIVNRDDWQAEGKVNDIMCFILKDNGSDTNKKRYLGNATNGPAWLYIDYKYLL